MELSGWIRYHWMYFCVEVNDTNVLIVSLDEIRLWTNRLLISGDYHVVDIDFLSALF